MDVAPMNCTEILTVVPVPYAAPVWKNRALTIGQSGGCIEPPEIVI